MPRSLFRPGVQGGKSRDHSARRLEIRIAIGSLMARKDYATASEDTRLIATAGAQPSFCRNPYFIKVAKVEPTRAQNGDYSTTLK
jgi:hypothetical protein